jgi:hypothetical protein
MTFGHEGIFAGAGVDHDHISIPIASQFQGLPGADGDHIYFDAGFRVKMGRR